MNSDSKLLNFILGIETSKLQNIAKWSLGMWIVYPLIIMILNALSVEGIYVYLIWMYLLYFVGTIGLIVGLIRFLQIVYSDGFEIKRFVINYLPFLFLVLFLIWSLFSCLLSDDKYMAFYGMIPMTTSWFTFLSFGGFLVLSMILSEDKRLMLRVVKLFVWISFALAFITLLDNSFSDKLTIVEPYTNCFHYQSVFYNTNHYAYYLLISILTSFFVALYSDKYKVKIAYILPYVLGIVVLIFNNTFGAFLSLTLTLIFVFLWFLIYKEKGLRIVLVLIVIFVITVIATSFFTDNLKVSLFGMTSDLGTIIGDDDVTMVGSGRGELWSNAIECIRAQPIFGCGFENHGKFGPSVDSSNEVFVTQPHNFLLFYAKYTGIPGLLLYLSALISGVVKLIKNREMNNSATETAAFIMVAYLASEFFGVIKFYTAPYYCIALGFCLLAYRELESNQYEKKSN